MVGAETLEAVVDDEVEKGAVVAVGRVGGGAARATGLLPLPAPHAAGNRTSAPIASTRRARRVIRPTVWFDARADNG